MSKILCITNFQDVDEAIAFAKEVWPYQDLDAIRSMRAIQAKELKKGAGWLCMIGVCDICGTDAINFIPACIYDDGISAVECFNCGNMSVYPKEQEQENEI